MARNRIVVGVDGSSGARSALRWAADESRIRGTSLLVVHAPDNTDASLIASSGASELRVFDTYGDRLLSEHVAAASARQPGVPVASMLSHDSPVDALIALSGGAEMLVVGTRGQSGVTSTMLGSVSHRVAAGAHCPVAVVPERYPREGNMLPPRVVAGVSAAPAGRLALQIAFEEAQLRGATLVAVRAWGSPDASLLLDLDAPAAERWRARVSELLHSELAALANQYPRVTIEPRLMVAEPRDALLTAAEGAQLIVVGCHHSADRWSTRLGPVPSAILHRAPCPVIVVGESRRARRNAAEEPMMTGELI